MDGIGAYGSGRASGIFDVVTFLKKPQVILRLVSLLFSIIVFGCISNQGWDGERCRYNGDANACGFGTTVGVVAFLGIIVLLALDFYFDNLSSVQHRKYAVMGDLGFSGFWAFLYFVNFCYLTDSWRKTDVDDGLGESGTEAAIAFSFFSIGTFSGLTYLAFLRYRKGVTESFAAGFEPEVIGANRPPIQTGPPNGVPQNQFPSSYSQSGQGQPFGGGQMASGDFQQVTY